MAQTHKFSIADFQAIDPEGGKGGRWLCPTDACAAHTDPSRHRSVSMVIETGLWNCKRCDARGQLTEKWKPIDQRSFKERIQEKERREQAMIRQTVSAPRDEYTIPVLTDEEYKDLLYRSGTLRPINEAPVAQTYLYGRGFTEADLCILHLAGVRYAHDFGREVPGKEKNEGRQWLGRPAIVFPVRGGDNSLVACQGRFLNPVGNLPKVLTFGHRAYGLFKTFVSLENETRQIGVCEAPLDALALAVKGTPSVALCGCTGLPKWFLHQSHSRRFLIATDADEAGDTAALKLSRELKQVGAYTARLRPSPQKDFADMLLHGTLLPLANQEEVKEFTRVLKILLANDSDGIVQSLVSQMAGMDQAAQEAVDALDLMIAEWRMVNNV